MSTITLTWQALDGQLRVVELDAYQGESHEDIVTITDHPVERGITITDHAKDAPASVSLEGLVSNLPMPGKAGVTSGPIDLSSEYMAPEPATRTIPLDVTPGPITPSLGGLIRAGIDLASSAVLRATVWGEFKRKRDAVKATVLKYGTPTNRPQAIDLLLREAIALKALVTVTTPLRTVGNLLITRLHPSRSVANGTAVAFQIDLRQIRVASSETVDAPVPAESRGAQRKSAGAQSTKQLDGASDETPEKKNRRKTIAKSLADG